MNDSMGFEVELPMAHEAALGKVREALKAEGFGVLTEIDLRAAFKEKLGKDFRPYVILGACNPPLAYAAVTADATVGLLLPCNVTVEAKDASHSVVRLVDPRTMLASTPTVPSMAVQDVASDAYQRIRRVVADLQSIVAVA